MVALVVPFVVFAVPQVVGAEHSYVVLSSSMSPTYEAGDGVIVNEVPPEEVSEGDVITFEQPSGMEVQAQGGTDLVTHRVVEVVRKDGDLYFRTKGDANEEPDKQLVPAENVVGTVQFGIPYIGYATTFAGSRTAQFALIVVPAVLLVANEIWTLVRAAQTTGEAEADSAPEGE